MEKESDLCLDKGEARFYKESFCFPTQLVHFYTNKEFKFTLSDWPK